MTTMKLRNPSLGLVGAAVFLPVMLAGCGTTSPNSNAPITNAVTAPSSTMMPVNTSSMMGNKVSTYKNGQYTVTGNYWAPEGMERMSVSVTLTNDVITDTTVTNQAQDPTSRQYQGMFISSYKSMVVGKDISTLNLTRVSGSSLTPQGFNDALAKIKQQASS